MLWNCERWQNPTKIGGMPNIWKTNLFFKLSNKDFLRRFFIGDIFIYFFSNFVISIKKNPDNTYGQKM